MLSMFPLYIFLFSFDVSFFLTDHNGKKAVQLFCAIPVAIVFLIVFHDSITIVGSYGVFLVQKGSGFSNF